MKIFCVALLLVICSFCGTGMAQDAKSNSVESARVDDVKPTVYLRVDRKDKEKVWLRMYNNTRWAVAVRTFTVYFNRKRTTQLVSGGSVSTLPSDEEINSLHYYLEKNLSAPVELKLPELSHGDSSSISWITSKGSILFSVPLKQLQPGLMIYVPFHYEWELNSQLIFNNEPEHRAYFRGVDLSQDASTARPRN